MSNRIVLRFCAVLIFALAASVFVRAAEAQGASKLVLTVTPLGAAASDKPIPVAANVGINIVVKNEGSDPISGVVLIAKLNGVKLVPGDGWKEDGENARLEIAAIKASEEITQRLNIAVEMAPLPPGKQIEVVIEAKAGEATLNARTKFPVADCAAAYQAELTKLRINKISEIWPTADEMRKPDTTLPRTRYFQVRMRRGDLANLDRLAAGYQARLLAHYDFFTEGVRYTARRWSDELKAFAGQEPNPGICAVNDEMIQGIRKTINYVTARLEPPMKAHARGMELLRKHFNAEDGDDLKKIALKVAEGAGAKFENTPATTFEILARAKDSLKDVKLTEEQLDNLSLIESAAWVEAQAMRSKKLNDLIEDSITGISNARKGTCVCAF
jgi:hypothetical protein